MADGAPIILEVVGDQFIKPCRISTLIWTGGTAAGDIATVKDPVDGTLIWTGTTGATQTYLGADFTPHGVHCPNGFRLTQIGGGKVLIYLARAV